MKKAKWTGVSFDELRCPECGYAPMDEDVKEYGPEFGLRQTPRYVTTGELIIACLSCDGGDYLVVKG